MYKQLALEYFDTEETSQESPAGFLHVYNILPNVLSYLSSSGNFLKIKSLSAI